VNSHNKHWFEAKSGKDADRRVQAVIYEEWKNAIASVGQLMPDVSAHEDTNVAA
jgi:hypothetical protein